MSENAFDVLERQHSNIAAVFDRIRDRDTNRAAALADATRLITTHVAVGRTCLYPVVKDRLVGYSHLGRELLSDYKRMQKLLSSVDRRKLNCPDMPGLITQLMDVFEDHQARCSTALVPIMQKELEEEHLNELGNKMRGAESVIVSHPHPYLLLLGDPIYQWATRVASRWDFLRDRTVTNR